MQQPDTWEAIMVGVLALIVLFWFQPGIKQAMQRGRNSEGKWRDLLVPLAMVVLFVVFLLAMAKK